MLYRSYKLDAPLAYRALSFWTEMQMCYREICGVGGTGGRAGLKICLLRLAICNAIHFIAYPAAFHASTPPFSTVTFLKPCARYFAARPTAEASPGQPQ